MYKRIAKLERRQKAAIGKFRRHNTDRDTETTELLLAILALQKEYRNQAVICDTLVAAWKSPRVEVSSKALPFLEGRKQKISITIPQCNSRDLTASHCQEIQTDISSHVKRRWSEAGNQDSLIASTVAESPARGSESWRVLNANTSPLGWSPRTRTPAEVGGCEELIIGAIVGGAHEDENGCCPMCGCRGSCADGVDPLDDKKRRSKQYVDGSCQTARVARKDSGVGQDYRTTPELIGDGTRLIIRRTNLVGDDIPLLGSENWYQPPDYGHVKHADTQTPRMQYRDTGVDAGAGVECSTVITQTPPTQSRSVSSNTTIVMRRQGSTDTTDLITSRQGGTQTPVIEYRSVQLGEDALKLAEAGSQYEQLLVRTGSSQTPEVRHSHRGVDPFHTEMASSMTQTPPGPRTRDTACGGEAVGKVGMNTDTRGLYTVNDEGTQTPEQHLAYREWGAQQQDATTEEISEVWGLELLSAPDAVIREIWGDSTEEQVRLTDSSYSGSSRMSNADANELRSWCIEDGVPAEELHSSLAVRGGPVPGRTALSKGKRGSGISKVRGKGRRGTSSRSSWRRQRLNPSSVDRHRNRDRYASFDGDQSEPVRIHGALREHGLLEMSGRGAAAAVDGWLRYDSLGQNIRWRALEGDREGEDYTTESMLGGGELMNSNEPPREVPVMLEDTLVEQQQASIVAGAYSGGHPMEGGEGRVLVRLYTSPQNRQGILIELPSEVFVEWAKNAWAVTSKVVPMIPKSRSWLTESELERREEQLRNGIVVVPAATRRAPVRRRRMVWFHIGQRQYRTLRAVLGITPRIFPLPKPLGRQSSLLGYH
ncbi:hypothetical protein FOZ60_006340 [Perkinsus olseni]|uniref:Uncharacterized protein n=1 Tax=Perkinsus olseni TaxID=32597 RepID=A0A7J6NNZ5_PEROL|nr:hypothetical protein FOZ60_006340 [Perkinsus olseni]